MMRVPQKKHLLHVISYIIIIASSIFFQQCEEATSPDIINLSAPTNVQIEILSNGSVKLLWQATSVGEQGFQIERKLGNNGVFQGLASVDNSRNFYIDSTAKVADSTYFYRIRPFYNYQMGEFSVESALNLGFAPPANLQINNENIFAVNLQWSDTVTNEQGFQVERKTENGAYQVIGKVNKNVSIYADSSLLVGETKYTYRVKSFGPGLTSSPTNEVIYTPAFNRPLAIDVTFEADSVAVITWTANNSLVSGYKIEFADTLKTYTKADSQKTTVSSVRHRAQFKVNDTYYYRVYNIGGNRISKASALDSAIIRFIQPKTFQVTSAAETKLTFSWIDSSTIENKFELERREGLTGSFVRSTVSIPANAVTATYDTTLKTNVWYYFRLRAVSAKNNATPYSNLDSVFVPFNAPSGLQFKELSPSSFRLEWFDNSSIENGFTISLFNLVTNKDSLINVAANTTNYTFNGLGSAVQYAIKVRGFSAKNNLTNYSTEIKAANTAYSLVQNARINSGIEVSSVSIDSTGNKVIVAGRDGNIKVLDGSSGNTLITIVSDSASRVNAMDISPDNNKIVAGYDNGRVVVWDINTGAKIVSTVFPNACLSVAWSKKTNQIGAGFSDGKSYILNPISFVKTSLTPDHLAAVYSVGFGNNDQLFITGSADSTIKVYKLSTGIAEAALPNSPLSPVLSAAFMPGAARRLVFIDKAGNVKVRVGTDNGTSVSYAATSVATTHQAGAGLVGVLDFTSFISIGSDNLLKLNRYPTYGVVNTLTPHTSAVISLAVSANAKYIALAAKDNTVSIWKIESRWEKL